VTVTAFDQYGNIATGYTGTVHFGSSDGQAVLPAPDYTFAGADEGFHAFHQWRHPQNGRRRQPNCRLSAIR